MARTPCPQARPVRQTRPLRRAALCRRWGLHDPRERQRAPGPEHERAERGQLHHQTEIEVTVAKCDPHALFKSHAAPSSNRNTLLWDIGDVGAGWKPRVAPALLVLLLPAWEKVFVSGGAELFHRLAGGQHRGCIVDWTPDLPAVCSPRMLRRSGTAEESHSSGDGGDVGTGYRDSATLSSEDLAEEHEAAPPAL
ncbi:hypothetical protein PHYSODRAFT_335199 [Phytophthora sojae]|nr:hypothetical protein PHYSODRAFT_335199 [Phytophthora sojae]EGZ13422.1 hypothetical protein PHYSODRAFT_335199 [Phytophthora sojae]|eukprot:XP_009530851.1 hypothetical protein PHYSODRAFT_335199 [Phytophthora sojae]